MMFDEYTKNKIILGEKTVTRRLRKNDKRPAIPNKFHKLKIDRTPNCYGYIKILSCEKGVFGDLTEEDAKLEGFSSKNEYEEYFLRVNGSIDSDLPIWIISFEYYYEL